MDGKKIRDGEEESKLGDAADAEGDSLPRHEGTKKAMT
jgi:hypothetical protein